MTRKLYNRIFHFTAWFSIILCFTILFFLLGVIIYNGISAVDFQFIFESSRKFGAEGGILYQIIGSLLMVFTAAIICFPIAIGVAIFKSEYLKSKTGQKVSDILLYGLNGIPSVIYGIFGLIVFVNVLGTGVSWFVGSIILAIMMLPTVTMSAYHALNTIPTIYRESAYALGMNKWQVITNVLLKQGFNGAVTGLFIGLARAIGETAPIMFIATAFSGVGFPSSLLEPVPSLPTHILALSQQATNPEALQNAWGTSFILITIVLSFSLIALLIRMKIKSSSIQ